MKTILSLLFGVTLFVTLIWAKFDDISLVSTISQKLSGIFYISIFLLVNCHLVFRATRFMSLFNNSFENKISFTVSFLLSSASFFIALITPLKVGDTLRGLFLKDQLWKITAITLIEFIYDAIIMIIIPLLGILLLYQTYLAEITTGLAVVTLFLLVAIILYKCFSFALPGLDYYDKYRDNYLLLKRFLKTIIVGKMSLLFGLLQTCLIFGVYFLLFYATLRKFGAQITFFETVVAGGIGILIGSLSFIPMGVGTRDASAYGILVSLGVNSEMAMSTVVIMRSLSLSLILVSSICYFICVRRF
jgi:uncharacterized membrane protein YbhN (UPF0104 family)